MTPRIARDGTRRGAPRGAKHPNAKLTQAQVDEMRRLRSEGWQVRRIAWATKVSPAWASLILRGLAWRPAS